MKKKLLSTMLAVAMVLSLLPTVAFAAGDAPKVYESGSQTLTLEDDFSADGDDGAILVKSGATLTINGTGSVHAENTTGYGMAVWAQGEAAKVVINGGYYANDPDTTDSGDTTHVDLIYASSGANIEINGGTFKCTTPKWTLNCKDESDEVAASLITVKGGKFYQFDPSNFEGAPAGKTEVVVADGYAVRAITETDGTWYEVYKLDATNSVAEVNGKYYTTLAEAVAAANDGNTVELLRDTSINDQITIDKKVAMDLAGNTLTMNAKPDKNGAYYGFYITDTGDFTLNDSVGAGKFVSTALTSSTYSTKTMIECFGKFTMNGGTIVTGAYNYWALGVTGASCDMVLNGGKVVSKWDTNQGAGIAANGTKTWENYKLTINDGFEADCGEIAVYLPSAGTVTINGGKLSGGMEGVEIRAGDLTINGGTIMANHSRIGTAENFGNGSTGNFAGALVIGKGTNTSATGYNGNLTVTVNGGTISNTAGDAFYVADTRTDTTYGKVTVNVADANVTGNIFENDTHSLADFAISGGYFTSDPSAYVADGYATVLTDDPTYKFTVGEANTEAPAEVVPAPPAVVADPKVDEAAATKISTALTDGTPSISQDVLNAAANTEANDNTTTAKQGLDALGTIATEAGKGESDVKIVVQPYMDIKITGATLDGDTIKSVTFDITPMYQKVATIADNLTTPGAIKVKDTEGVDDNEANAVAIGEPDVLTLPENTTVTVTVPLPEDFIEGTTNVLHKKDDGKQYIYEGTISSEHILTFKNPHGFSEITVGAADPVAKIGTTGYLTLQAAVDEADGAAITVLKDGLSAAIYGNTSFKIEKGEGVNTVDITAAPGYVLTDNNNGTYTIAREYTGGVSTYPITVSDAEHGTVTASRKTASKGTAVTLTVKADEGYALADLTVTDKNGNEIELTEKDGKYTFKMPGSKVTVTAAFAPVFDDVFESDYYYKEVLYAYSTGLMVGFDGSFGPNGSFDRKQLAMLLWNMEGNPVVETGLTFTDVPADVWYTDAVRWAASTGAMIGYGGDLFGPDDLLTRQQLATAFYRYAEAKAETGDLSGFTDAANVDAWAADGVIWAVNHNLIQGYNNSLTPDATAIRAQVAVMLARYLKNIA